MNTDLSTISTQASQQTMDLLEIATSSDVLDDESYAMAGHHLLQWTRIKKEIGKTFDPVVQAAHRAHREAIAGRDRHLTIVEDACTTIKEKMGSYHRAMEKLAQDAQEEEGEEFAPLPAPPPEVGGISHRTTWSAEITDPKLLLQHCLPNWDQWGKLVKPDQKAINQLARSMKDSLDTILPGVRAVAKSSVAARA